MIDRLERDPEAPPSDALAEAVVLRELLFRPHLIERYDPALLLVFPEHRIVLACMRKAYRGTHAASPGTFYVAWMAECERARPGQGLRLVRLLDFVDDDLTRWQWREAKATATGKPFAGLAPHAHPFEWWFQRLRDCAEARRLISVAQRMAESAWRGDVTQARAIAQKAAVARPGAIRVDV